MARIDELLQRYRLLQLQRYRATAEARKEGQQEVIRIGDRLPTGQYQVIHQSGSITSNGVKIFNASYQRGQVVRATQAEGQPTIALDWRNVTKQQPPEIVEPLPIVDGIPILFTRLNSEGDRQFWLGGDRANPILLDTFSKLSLNTNPWELQGGSTVPASPTISANFTGTEEGEQANSSLLGLTNLPLYLLSRVTGRLEAGAGQTATAGYLSADRRGGATDAVVEATESIVTITDTLGAVRTLVNRGSVELLPPVSPATNRVLVAEFNIAREFGFSGTSSVAATIEFEFIPCYLTATKSHRYVLLQPEIGTLKYYRIDAKTGAVSKATYTTDPINSAADDWRNYIATFTYPYFGESQCYRDKELEFGPYTSTFENIGEYWASNFAGGKLYRLDSRQGSQREKLFFTDGAEPLVFSEDVQLEITVSDFESTPSTCSLSNETTVTKTIKALKKSDALILAIAPIV